MIYSIVTYGFGPSGSRYEIPVYGFTSNLNVTTTPLVDIEVDCSVKRSKSLSSTVESFYNITSLLNTTIAFSSLISIENIFNTSLARNSNIESNIFTSSDFNSSIKTIPVITSSTKIYNFYSSTGIEIEFSNNFNTTKSFDSEIERQIEFVGNL